MLQLSTVLNTWISTEDTTLGAQSDILDIRRSSDVITFLRGNWKLNVSSQLDSSMTAFPWKPREVSFWIYRFAKCSIKTIKTKSTIAFILTLEDSFSPWDHLMRTDDKHKTDNHNQQIWYSRRKNHHSVHPHSCLAHSCLADLWNNSPDHKDCLAPLAWLQAPDPAICLKNSRPWQLLHTVINYDQ